MSDKADLEIGLHRGEGRNWSVELRFSSPRTDTMWVSDPASTTFDFASLQELTYDKDEYGRVLGDNLFKARGIGSRFKEARDEAERTKLPLRIRLFVGPSALELHGLLWETIRDPEADVPLLLSENVVFARYLTDVDWRLVGVRPKTDLRAVVLVANPIDVGDYRTEDGPVPPIDVDAELERARVGLRDLGLSPAATTELVGSKCSVGALSDALRRCDILYVVCYGFVSAGKPQLLLEDGSGKVERVPGEDFVS